MPGDGLHGIADEIHENPGQLRLRPHHHDIFQAYVLELEAVPVVEHRQLFLQEGRKVDFIRLLRIQLRKGREFVGGLRKHVDVIEQSLAAFVEFVLPALVSLALETHQALYLELHRSERILDLVGDLPGHSAPRLVALRLSQLAGALAELGHHVVVGIHEAGNLILAIVLNVLELPDPRGIHLGPHLNQRLEHQRKHAGHHERRHQQQENEQRDYHQGMAYDIRFEVVAFIGIRRTDDGQHRTVFSQQRGIHTVVRPLPYPLLMDKIPACILDY